MKSREFLLSYQATCKFITEFNDHPSSSFFSGLLDHLSLPCHPIFFYFLCPSCRLGLHVEGLQGRLKPFRVKVMKQTQLSLVTIDTCQKYLMLASHSHFLPFYQTSSQEGLGGDLEEGGRKPPSCHNTELRILLRFDANVSDSPWFILKLGGEVGRRAREPLNLWALRSCLMRTLGWTPLFPSPPKNDSLW